MTLCWLSVFLSCVITVYVKRRTVRQWRDVGLVCAAQSKWVQKCESATWHRFIWSWLHANPEEPHVIHGWLKIALDWSRSLCSGGVVEELTVRSRCTGQHSPPMMPWNDCLMKRYQTHLVVCFFRVCFGSGLYDAFLSHQMHLVSKHFQQELTCTK